MAQEICRMTAGSADSTAHAKGVPPSKGSEKESGSDPRGRVLPPILFLGDHFGYPSGVAHGVTTYFLDVLPALALAGVDIAACFLRDPHPLARQLEGSGVEPVFCGAHPFDPFVVMDVVKLAKRRGCRIIHASGIKATLIARIVGRIVGAEVIVHVHDLVYPSTTLGALHRLFSRPTDLGLCVSQAVEDVAADGYHVSRERLRVVYNGVELDRVRNVPPGARATIRAELGVPASAGVIALVGRMYPVKGHPAMLRMMARISKACPDARLVLVGDGPGRVACEALTSELGLQSRVIFLGHRDDVPCVLAAADVVVVPSESEGLCLAAIEGLAAGKPVVAYAVGGLPEVVTEGKDGRLIAAANEDEFVQAVVALLQDPGLRSSYGRYAAQAAGRFSLERHVDALLRCYGELAAGALSASASSA
jgi:glycosyltransferase involved in cell wall biosynthesis